MRYPTAFVLATMLCSTLNARQLHKPEPSRMPHRGANQEAFHPGLRHGEPGQLQEPAPPENRPPGLKKSTLGQLFLPDTVIAFGTSDTTRHIYTYDADGHVMMEVHEDWDGTNWVYYYRDTLMYDAHGNMLTDLAERWNGIQWENSRRYSYTYDGSGNRLTDLSENWGGTQWWNGVRLSYSYDPSGNMLTWLSESWDGTQWYPLGNNAAFPSGRHTYTYDVNGNRLTDLHEFWVSTQWESSFRTTYSFDANGNQLSYLGEFWDGTQWVNGNRNTSAFDDNGNMLMSLTERWNGTDWVPFSYRETFTYDANGNRLTALDEFWDGTQWVNSMRDTYTYDATGNLLTYGHDRWFTTHWATEYRSSYTYDINGNITRIASEEWDGNAWKPCDRWFQWGSIEWGSIRGISGGSGIGSYINRYSVIGYDISFHYVSIATGVPGQSGGVAGSYELFQNYPNPFNPSTTIAYSIPGDKENGGRSVETKLVVYDCLGREVAVLVNEKKTPGSYQVKFEPTGLASGVYLYRLSAGMFTQTRKMLLLR